MSCNYGYPEMRGRTLCFIFALVLVFTIIAACSGDKSQSSKPPPVPVVVAEAVKKTVPVQIRAVGNAEPYSTVSVKSQVGGILTRVHFREGQDVRKGDLLFSIDSRPYEASLKQAEANLAKDAAQLENARVEVRRYEELVRKGYVAQEQYDQIRTSAATLEAVVNAGKALVEHARLQLQYCSIHSPITGRTGNLIANQGNLIKANADTAMITINQIQPIYVTFSVPEHYLGEIKKYIPSGKLSVTVITGKDEKHPEQGVVTFVDNSVDTATGTIKLKAAFSNAERRLWPGQFVDVVMTLTARQDATVVPSQAVQTGQQGSYVFVIKPDLSVESRPVEVSLTHAEETVIEKGLQPGERVVTDGQMRIFPGAIVEVKPPVAAERK